MVILALLRFLRSTPWSTMLALTGVTLGVVSIVSVHLVSARLSAQLDDLTPGGLTEFAYFLHADDLSANDYFALRRAWRKGELPDVEHLAPVIDETTFITGVPVRIIGLDLLSFSRSVEDLVVRGEAEQSVDITLRGVWVDATLKDQIDRPINGILPMPPGTLVADLLVAHELLGSHDEDLSYIGVAAVDPLAATKSLIESMAPGMTAGLPAQHYDLPLDVLPGGEARSWQVVRQDQANPATQFGKSVLFNVGALGLLALVVAWFLIYQVAVSWLRRLWPIFQRLHILGMSWMELAGSFIAIMLVVGACAFVLGIFLGEALANLLLARIIPSGEALVGIDGVLLLKALFSALAVCGCGAALAFFDERRSNQQRYIARVSLLVLLVGIVVLGISMPRFGLVGAFAAIAALGFIATLLIIPILDYSRRFAHLLSGPLLARLSLREVLWYPKDLGVAMGGLALAVATALGLGLMVDSFRADFTKMLDRRLAYDLAVSGDPTRLEGLVVALANDPAIERLQQYRTAQSRLQGRPVEVVATRLDAAELARYGVRSGLFDPARDVLVSEQLAAQLQLIVGTEVAVGAKSFKTGQIFSGFGDVQGRVIVDEAAVADLDAMHMESVRMNVVAAADALADLSARLRADGYLVELQGDIRASALRTFDQTFAITDVLLAIALLVAGIGIYIALNSMRLNRRASVPLLVGLGLTRRENFFMDLTRGLGVGCVAVAIAVPLGLAFGWILCAVVNPRAFGWTVDFTLQGAAIMTPVAVGIGASTLAGLLAPAQTSLADTPGSAGV